MDNATYEKEWTRPVHRIGRITLLGVCITSFLPIAYLYFMYGIVPPIDWVITDIVLITASFGFIWLIEPITFFPVLGTIGSYEAFLTGNIGTSKLPAAAVAQDITRVEPGSKEAEVVSSLAIIGSTTTTVAFVCLGAIAGSAILGALPPDVLDAIKAYVTPAVFGALMVTFTVKFPKVIPVAIGVPLLLRLFAGGVIPGYLYIVFTLVATVIAAVLLYRGRIKDDGPETPLQEAESISED